MASAVIAAMALTILLQTELQLRRHWVVWLLVLAEGLLLLALIVADPGAITRRSSVLRAVSVALVSVLVISALWATGSLISDLIHGGPETNSAGDLLAAGSIVWVSNNIAFGLLYWELDGGGAAARDHESPRRIDLAFPQETNPALVTPNWRPRFIDYLYLGFTNATAFSPTDVMPLVPWAKVAMALQSLASLAILGLVVARAVNVLT